MINVLVNETNGVFMNKDYDIMVMNIMKLINILLLGL